MGSFVFGAVIDGGADLGDLRGAPAGYLGLD
jgi:hypothetical protein